MKTIKGLVLGSAACLLAIGGAQAADLPVKAKAVEYVRICSLYGAGFFYIPGTDTCIKLGGYLRIDTTFNGGIYNQPAWSGDLGQGNRYRDYFASRSRMALTVDTRTATEYGVVRTFGQGDFQFDTLGNGTVNPNALATNLGNNPNLLNTPGGGYVAVEMVFIQFAGFTFGKSASDQPVRRRGLGEVWRHCRQPDHRAGAILRCLFQGHRSREHGNRDLQPELQPLGAWRRDPLDSRQESDVLRGSHVDPPQYGLHGNGDPDPPAPMPTAVYQFKNQDTVSFNVRAQRNF